MKTLTPGTLPTPGAWWAGYQASCPKCGARYEYEAKDQPYPQPDNPAIRSADVVQFQCTTEGCYRLLAVRKS